jgi:hypothetical protein
MDRDFVLLMSAKAGLCAVVAASSLASLRESEGDAANAM